MTDTMGEKIDRLKAQQKAEREKLLRALGEMGKAEGLLAGAKILHALSDRKSRVVGTNELKAAAASMVEVASELRKKAELEIAAAKGRG